MKRLLTHGARTAMTLLALFLFLTGARADELTVYDGTDNSSYVPFYGMYADTEGAASEFVIPSDELTAMTGGSIIEMTFYLKQPAAEAWTGTHQVYLGVVAETTLTSITGPDANTVVATGSFDATGTELTVSFDTPYKYGGGNLLIGTYVSVAGNYKSAYFYGANQTENTAWYRKGASAAGSGVKFIPKTTFTYTGGSGVVVEKPQTFEVSSITSSGAVLTWTGGTGTYNVEYKKVADADWTVALSNTTALTYTFTGLESNTAYQARVQSVSGSDVSGWKSLSFTTAIGFPYIEDFTAGLPATWTRYNGLLENILNNTANLASATSGWSVGTTNGVLDGNNAYANIYGTYQRWLVTPAILLPANAKITFDVAYTAYSGTAAAPAQDGDDDKFVVLISTDDMATWTILRQWDNAGSSFVLNNLTPAGENVSITLGAYAGQSVNVAFYTESTVSNADNNLHIDNVTFKEKDPFEKPTNLSVNYTSDLTATVTWTAAEGAVSYDIDVNGTVTEGVSSPYELTGLLLSGTYEVKVRTNYGGGNYSEWTNTVTFKTDDCMNADKCYITYELSANAYNGAYTYGWYYSGIDVYNADTNELIDFWTVDANNATATGALQVCPGTNLSFQWYCSYSADNDNLLVGNIVIKDANGEDIINTIGALTAAIDYTVDCTISEFKTPTNLTATWVGATTADLSWTENGTATSWVISITDNDEDKTWEETTSENPYTITNLTPGTEYYVKVRPGGENDKWSKGIIINTAFTAPADLAADNITTSSATITWKGDADKYNLRYAAYTPGEVLFSDDFESGGLDAKGWTVVRNDEGTDYTDWRVINSNTVFSNSAIPAHSGDYVAMSRSYNGSAYSVDNWLITPAMELDGTLTYWAMDDGAYHEHYDIYVCTTTFDADAFDESAFTKIYEPGDASGEWVEHTVDLSAYAGQTGYIAFRNTDNDQDFLFIDDVVISKPDIKGAYTDEADVTSPYALEGLADKTAYIVEVQGAYGKTSTDWTSINFTTLAADAAPTNLEIADVSSTTATLSWNGVQDNYNVKLTKLPVVNVDEFTQVGEDKTATGELTEYSFDLSSYSGTGAIAIRHYNVTDMFRLNVDDITLRNAASEVVLSEDFESGSFPSGWINNDADGDGNMWGMWHITQQDSQGNDVGNGSYCITSASYNGGALTPDNWLIIPNVELGGTLTFVARGQDPGWPGEVFGVFVGVGAEAFIPAIETTFENVTSPYTLDNLLPGTDYTVQVQAIYKGSPTEWSEAAAFTTNAYFELANDATDNSAIITANAGKVADVKLTDRTLYKDNSWNTICLPFDVTIAGSPLAGATAKTLDDATVTTEKVSLDFGDVAVTTLEAGKPYIIKWNAGENIVNPTFANVTISSSTDHTISKASGEVQFIGYYDAFPITAADENIYYMTSDNKLMHTGKDRTLKSCRAYFWFSDDIVNGGSTAREFILNFGDDETTTSINEIDGTRKMDDSVYDLHGRKIENGKLRNGLYIVNGKKQVVRSAGTR